MPRAPRSTGRTIGERVSAGKASIGTTRIRAACRAASSRPGRGLAETASMTSRMRPCAQDFLCRAHMAVPSAHATCISPRAAALDFARLQCALVHIMMHPACMCARALRRVWVLMMMFCVSVSDVSVSPSRTRCRVTCVRLSLVCPWVCPRGGVYTFCTARYPDVIRHECTM